MKARAREAAELFEEREDCEAAETEVLEEATDTLSLSTAAGGAVAGGGGMSNAGGAELEQSKAEHALVVELTKLEGGARTKMLLSQLKDLRKRHAIELERLHSDHKGELELNKAQTAALVEEIRSLKQTVSFQADSLSDASQTRTSTLDTKLQLEKNKRKEMVRHFESVEEQLRVTVEELESVNLALQQRCEKAELQVTRLKMELVAAGAGISGLRTSSSNPAKDTAGNNTANANATNTPQKVPHREEEEDEDHHGRSASRSPLRSPGKSTSPAR